jgi:hypothetical protein
MMLRETGKALTIGQVRIQGEYDPRLGILLDVGIDADFARYNTSIFISDVQPFIRCLMRRTELTFNCTPFLIKEYPICLVSQTRPERIACERLITVWITTE